MRNTVCVGGHENVAMVSDFLTVSSSGRGYPLTDPKIHVDKKNGRVRRRWWTWSGKSGSLKRSA